MGRPKDKPRKRVEANPLDNPRQNIDAAATLFLRQYGTNLIPAVLDARGGIGCIVVTTTDGAVYGWGPRYEGWPVVTIKAGTTPRGAARPQEAT